MVIYQSHLIFASWRHEELSNYFELNWCLLFFLLPNSVIKSFCWHGSISSRSSRPEVLCKIGVLRNFGKFTGKHLWQSLFLIKLQAAGLKFPRKPFFLPNTSGGCFWIFFTLLKYVFIIRIFHWIFLCWAYLVFHLYSQKSEL